MDYCPKKNGFYGLTNKTRIFLLQDLLGWSTSSILHRPNPTEISTRDYTTSISLKAYENAIQIPLKHYYAHILIPWNSHENPTISSHPSSHIQASAQGPIVSRILSQTHRPTVVGREDHQGLVPHALRDLSPGHGPDGPGDDLSG